MQFTICADASVSFILIERRFIDKSLISGESEIFEGTAVDS